MVVCKPDYDEINHNSTSTASGGGATASATGANQATSNGGASTSASGSTGAANTLDVAHATVSKAGLAMLAMLAVGSAAGMFL